MNSQTGEIKHFNSATQVPRGWIVLTEDEARRFLTLPRTLRIEHYMKVHKSDKCEACGCFIGNHSIRVFKEHARDELAKFDIERLEQTLAAAPAPQTMRLFDRADGVKDHFCIGREVQTRAGNYYEFWNPKSTSQWASAGKVIVGREQAEQKMKELQRGQAAR